MYRREQRDLFSRLVVAIIAAIPIFVIGIVYMSLLKEGSPGRNYFEKPIWAGQVTRGEWALFLASTPVMFYAAAVRHILHTPLFLWLIMNLICRDFIEGRYRNSGIFGDREVGHHGLLVSSVSEV